MAKVWHKVCPFPGCGVEFTVSGKGAPLRKYCDEHYIGNTSPTGRKKGMSKQQLETGLYCYHCGRKMNGTKRREGAKFCSSKCTKAAAIERNEARRSEMAKLDGAPPELARGIVMSRRGPVYEQLKARPELLRQLLSGYTSQVDGAEMLGTTTASISRSLVTIRYENEMEIRNGEWEPHRFVRAMLPIHKLERVRELGPEGEGTEEFERLIDELVRAYAVFSRRYFTLEGKRPIVAPFHLRWVRAIIVAYAVGGKQMILSPPRHGKSEALIRFAVWMIVMFPNIRIMWVAANTDVAKLMLGAVKDHLTNNEDLIADTLPEGHSYKPERQSGKPWSSKEIKVAQQTHVGQKSSSMICLGRTTKILSRDVDILITDDLEDFDTTREPSQRQYSRNKLAEIGTRKEERTAWLYIASRQHPDDIPNHLLALEGTSQAWRVIVETAHDETVCELDPDVIEGHDEAGCVLFPEVRSYRWLMEKKGEMDALGIPGAYEMRYLNAPVPETGIVFDIRLIREEALDRSRDIGIAGLPPGNLVAGLDPAARGTQAGFVWHYANDVMTMVDLEAQEAGGFAGAHRLMAQWDDWYGLKHWFYENNAQQGEFFNDPRTKQLILDRGLYVRPYQTGMNKTDPEIGISSMAPRYHNGQIILPFGTAEARKKTNMLLRQLELWTTDGVPRGRNKKTDIKMASWFPFPQIIKWGKQERSISLQETGSSSYPGFGFTNVPWTESYPGR